MEALILVKGIVEVKCNGGGENGLLFPCFYVYFLKVHQYLLNSAGGGLTSTDHICYKVE